MPSSGIKYLPEEILLTFVPFRELVRGEFPSFHPKALVHFSTKPSASVSPTRLRSSRFELIEIVPEDLMVDLY